MADLPSIQDLLQKNRSDDSKDATPSPQPSATSSVVEEKFAHKMSDIKKKELETEALRAAGASGFPHINLEKFPVSQEALRQVPRDIAEKISAVCFFATPDEVRIGAVDPSTPEVAELLHDVMERSHANGALYLISKNSFDKVLKLYDTLPIIKPINKDIEITSEALESVTATIKDFHSLQDMLNKDTTSNIVVIMLGAALKLEASDVHIEAEEGRVMVRFRLDGILHDVAELPKQAFASLVSRIKLVSSLKINIVERPQDGRFTIKLADGDVDVRVSTMPTVFGESIVMRLLRQNQKGLSLDSLGIRPRQLELLKTEIMRPNGMVVVTGPTGSGKTTTLYAVLLIVNKPGVKIITLEDPVEYRLEGINQSQIDTSKDYTFAKGLRSLLRQDPDIVMVGEIRDLETAEIAIQASLTGHLMLSTIHTNDASGAIPRFLSMGVKPFLLGPALNCIVGQRLVRILCDKCKKAAPLESLDAALQTKVTAQLDTLPDAEKKEVTGKQLTFYTAVGCDACNSIGYKGRLGIYEMLLVSDAVEQFILSNKVSEIEIAKMAMGNGMVTMAQDGILKALDGLTSLDEVFRVTE